MSGGGNYRSGAMRGGRAVVDYHHSSGGSRYRDGGTGSNNAYSNAPGYGNVSGYSGSFGYGGNPHYGSNVSGYGGANSYEGTYGSGHPGGGSAYNSTPNYAGGSNYGGPSNFGSGQMVSPWESGMAPGSVGGSQHGFVPPPRGSGGGMVESGGGGDASNIIGAVNQLTQMGTTESKLALNILNAVLTKGSPGEEGRANWENGPPANKMRRMDWDGGYGNRPGRAHPPPMPPPPVRKLPQRDQQNIPRPAFGSPQRGRGGHSYGPAGRHMMTDNQLRKTAKAMRGKPMPDTRDNKGVAKDQKRGAPAAATRTAVGQKGDKTEGDGSSATAGPKPSGATDDSKTKPKQEEISDDKENAEGADSAEKNAKAKKDAFVPRELLKCHMCDIDNFDCINHYQKHLQSKGHKTSALAFHAQGAAILQVLRAEAKLASQRHILKAWKSGVRGRGNLAMCGKCQCHVIGGLQDHNKTVEHLLVARYMKVKCCDQAYTVRGDLEEHRLSLLHFKWVMELEQKRSEREEKKLEAEADDITEEESLKVFYDAVDKIKNSDAEESAATLPPHDPTVPVGLQMIGTRSMYHCKVCPDPKVRMLNEHHVEAHFRSISHYLNLFAHLKKMQEMKNTERKKKQEEKKKQQEIKQEDGTQEEEDETETNGDVKIKVEEDDDKEEKSCEDADNQESVDETLDDADEDLSTEVKNEDGEEKTPVKDKDDTEVVGKMEVKNLPKKKKVVKKKQVAEKKQQEKKKDNDVKVNTTEEDGEELGIDDTVDPESVDETKDDVDMDVKVEATKTPGKVIGKKKAQTKAKAESPVLKLEKKNLKGKKEDKKKQIEVEKKQEEKKQEEDEEVNLSSDEQGSTEEVSVEDVNNSESVDDTVDEEDVDTSAEAANGAGKEEVLASESEEIEEVGEVEEVSGHQEESESCVHVEESTAEEVKAEVKEQVIQESEEQIKIATPARRRGRGRGRGRSLKN